MQEIASSVRDMSCLDTQKLALSVVLGSRSTAMLPLFTVMCPHVGQQRKRAYTPTDHLHEASTCN